MFFVKIGELYMSDARWPRSLPSGPRGPDEGSGVVPRAGMKIVTWKVHNIIRLLTTVVLVIASFTHTLIAHHMSSEIDYVIDHALDFHIGLK